MPNSTIEWLDPKERPIEESAFGRTVCIKSKHGTSVIKLDIEKSAGWMSSVSWINQADLKYIILPE